MTAPQVIILQMSPEELDARIAKLANSLPPTANGQSYITPTDLPDLSAADAARVIGCSVNRLTTLARRWPEYIRPIIAEKKSVRYSTEQILKAKKMNLLNRKV